MLLSPRPTPERAIAGFLEEGVKEVIVKRGNQGASYYSANEQFHVESYPVEEADPTGAGDCFWWRKNCLPPAIRFDAHRALQYANACGALAVTRRGPMEGTSRLMEIETFIQRHDMSIREAAQRKTKFGRGLAISRRLPELNTMELRSGRAKGTEAFDVRTGAGLAFTVVKDRALDIAWASYKDTALSLSPPTVLSPPLF